MRSILVALVCLAHAVCGRRVQSSRVSENQTLVPLGTLLSARTFRMPLNPFVAPAAPARNIWMAARDAELNLGAYNDEMVKSIESLRQKRDDWNRQILAGEEEKANIQKSVSKLTERLEKLDQSLDDKAWKRQEYDQTIKETEAAYDQILQSSQDLLTSLKRGAVGLSSKTTQGM